MPNRRYRFQLYVHADRGQLLEDVEEAAAQDGVSPSEWIWRAVEYYFARGGDDPR